MLTLLNCIRCIDKNPGSLVTMVVTFCFCLAQSVINSPITISSSLLSLNSLALNYIGLLISFSVSSIHITWLLEDALSICLFCSSRAVYCNKSVHQTFASSFSCFLPFAFVLMLYFHTLCSTDLLKTVWYEVGHTTNLGLLS